MIPTFSPDVSMDSLARVVRTLVDGRLSEGPAVPQFEAMLGEHFDMPNVVATNSGTAALHLAVLGCDIGPGDRVVTVAQSFEASAMVIKMVGAEPVFADIEMTGCIDPVSAAELIDDRTKALLVVHYGGCPCDMDALREVAGPLPIIEDCAHALGARYKGRYVGSEGIGCFSFQAIKQLTTIDGGVLVFADRERSEQARRRRWFGIDRNDRTRLVSEIGYKYHMNDVAASAGLGELRRFDEAQKRRELIRSAYVRAFESLGITLPEHPGRESACWLFTLLVERREDFINAMGSRGIEARQWHRRIDRHPIFGGVCDLPAQAEFDAKQVSIPSRANLTDEEVKQIIEAVEAGW